MTVAADIIRAVPPDYTLDFDRLRRVGFPEVVLAQGKTPAQIAEICRQLARAHDVLVTRLSPDAVGGGLGRSPLPGRADYDPRSATAAPLGRQADARGWRARSSSSPPAPRTRAVAEEARRTLEYLGVSSTLVPDVGVAGILRLLSRLEEIEKADVVIAVAGMEASLFSVIGGLVGRPLIAVPTSRRLRRRASAASLRFSPPLNSCANGVTAVNIDSGYAAAMAAYRILSGGPRRWDRKKTKGAGTPASTSTPPRSASTGSGRRRSSAADDAGQESARRPPSRELLDSYREASFQARALGNCAAVFEAMLRDQERPTIFLGMAGSLIAAGMRQVIVDLIEENMVDVVVSTGAIISQDFYQVRGGRHYHGHADADDKELRDLYIDRLYDTFIDEEKYWETDLAVSQFADSLVREVALLAGVPRAARREGAKATQGSILGACARNGVPLFVPGPERLLDRHRPDRALPPHAARRDASPSTISLDPRQLRAHADRRAEPGDRGALRLGRRARRTTSTTRSSCPTSSGSTPAATSTRSRSRPTLRTGAASAARRSRRRPPGARSRRRRPTRWRSSRPRWRCRSSTATRCRRTRAKGRKRLRYAWKDDILEKMTSRPEGTRVILRPQAEGSRRIATEKAPAPLGAFV